MERNENWKRARATVGAELDQLNTWELRRLSKALGFCRLRRSVNNWLDLAAQMVCEDREARKYLKETRRPALVVRQRIYDEA